MPTITVKNIPADLYDRLKLSAQTNRRSINSEVIVCIERAVGARPINADAAITRARALREKTIDYPITDDELTAAKTAGRP
jgi:plasmid stability protein